MKEIERCAWARSEIMIDYHDREWGVPLHDDRLLFEFLVLEGMQAGLSWETVLKKRENYRAAFHHFDAQAIARYKPEKIDRLLANPGIIRNRLKIESVVQNARSVIELRREFGSFDAYLWSFVGGRPIENKWRASKDVPATTAVSSALSKDLLKRGFKFVGPTICYAFMQATGMINDHLVQCFRYRALQGHS
jgi:DNA-3-methyladenine glycosylase I